MVDCCDKMNYFELEGYKVVHKDQLAKEILDITGWGLIKWNYKISYNVEVLQ